MFVVLDGLAHQLAPTPDAGELRSRSVFAEGRLVGKLRQGDVFGATSLVTGEPRSATVRAAVPTSALELGEEDFRALIARFPAILSNLTRILSGRLAAATRRQAGRGRRGEAVALIAGPSLASAVPAVVSAARAASPRPLESLDVGPGLDGRARAARRRAARAAARLFSRPACTMPSCRCCSSTWTGRSCCWAEEDGEPTARAGGRGQAGRGGARRASARRARRGGTGARASSGWPPAAMGTTRAACRRRDRLARPAPVPHEARAGARGGRRQGLRPRRRAGRARGCRLHGRLRRRQQHRRHRGRRTGRSAWMPPRSTRRCARRSPPSRGRGLQALAVGQVDRAGHDEPHLPGDDARALVRRPVIPLVRHGGRPDRP